MFFELEHFPGPGPVILGELTGRSEISVTGTGAVDAIRLLNTVIQDYPGAILGTGEAARMSISDRDRAMAHLQMTFFGKRIAGDSTCRRCEARFDFDFNLSDLLSAVAPADPSKADAAGWIEIEPGIRFRIPTGEDQLAAAGLDTEAATNAIVLRCVPEGTPAETLQAIEERAQRIAPLVDLTLDATCPECDTRNPLSFAVERYFLSSIRAERRRLLSEIHKIAMNYGWSFDGIVDLPRLHRRELVAQIERDRDTVWRSGVG